MAGGPRIRLIALVVLLAVATPLLIVAVSSSGGDESGAAKPSLRTERLPGATPEVVVYAEDPSANTPAAVGGERTVTVECLDSRDEVVFSSTHAWPFTDTDDGTLDPHQHLNIDEGTVNRVASCRLR